MKFIKIYLLFFIVCLEITGIAFSSVKTRNHNISPVNYLQVDSATIEQAVAQLGKVWGVDIEFRREYRSIEEARSSEKTPEMNPRKNLTFGGKFFWKDYLNIARTYNVGLNWYVDNFNDGHTKVVISTHSDLPRIIKAFVSEKYCIVILNSSTDYTKKSKEHKLRDVMLYNLPGDFLLDISIRSSHKDVFGQKVKGYFEGNHLIGRIPQADINALKDFQIEITKVKAFRNITLELTEGQLIIVPNSEAVNKVVITKINKSITDPALKPESGRYEREVFFELFGNYIRTVDHKLLDDKGDIGKHNYFFGDGKCIFDCDINRPPTKIQFKVPMKVEKLLLTNEDFSGEN